MPKRRLLEYSLELFVNRLIKNIFTTEEKVKYYFVLLTIFLFSSAWADADREMKCWKEYANRLDKYTQTNELCSKTTYISDGKFFNTCIGIKGIIPENAEVQEYKYVKNGFYFFELYLLAFKTPKYELTISSTSKKDFKNIEETEKFLKAPCSQCRCTRHIKKIIENYSLDFLFYYDCNDKSTIKEQDVFIHSLSFN